MTQPDIQTDDDIRTLVHSFYDRVQADPLLSPIFNDVEGFDWPEHLAVLVNFWSSLLLGRAAYKGHPFPKHLALPIYREHFSRWLNLFFVNVDARFAGPKAEEAKAKALSIATLFQHKMDLEPEAVTRG